ncbi:MAG: restriction endonuclease subunit S [Bacteroidia bacterium]|jgi:type I restriction enzyme S subunit|nr:restriction endonuclease subunit S [Bacteroidia bacterium]
MATGTKHTRAFYNTEIPGDWEIKKISEVSVKVGSGITPIGGESVYKSTGRPFLRSQNVGWGNLIIDDVAFIDEETHKSFQSTEIREGDVFLNITGASIGRSSIANKAVVGGNVNQHVCIIRTNKNVLIPKYLNAFLLSTIGQNLIESFQAGGNRQGLNFEQIKSFKIPLPPLPEQKAIAQVLSTADAAIQTTEQLIAQKEQRKKWLMQQLLTGKKRLKGFDGPDSYREWNEMTIGDLIVESRIPSIDNDVNKRITVKLKLKGIEKRDVRGSEAEDATYFFIRKKGQFIYGKQNLHKGAFGIIPEELDGFESSQDIPAFDFLKGVSPNFFMFFMSQEGFYQSLEKISTGTGSKRIHPENLYKVKVIFPSIEEQAAIAQVLQAADREISLLKAKVEKLREQKKGLMQVLLTGKKRLKFK